MSLQNDTKDQLYASILADGKLHVTVPEGTPGSVVRTYETSDGKTGSKTELVFTSVIGHITKVAFVEGDYGRQIQVTIEDKKTGEKPVVLTLSTSSNYGEDLMKKLINVDLEKPVKIVPFSFDDDKGKKKKGVTIWQWSNEEKKSVKVANYFYDPVKKKLINGYPEPKKTKKPLSKDQWKLYFGEAREFLVEKITEHFKIEEATPSASNDDLEKYMDSDAEEFNSEEEADKVLGD